jgi:hypothetical protein
LTHVTQDHLDYDGVSTVKVAAALDSVEGVHDRAEAVDNAVVVCDKLGRAPQRRSEPGSQSK